ncbi:hypothetical protein Pfo_002524 [Paulownia fortunei]|nr:hypothetical protein Pfo_002524 [Paulownia fortunei]
MNSSDQNNPSENNPSQNNPRKKGKGRQKINIAKLENETNRQVTFSKRRAGLFKKASELSTLCGVESAVVVFSPGNKAHSFGHPNVDTIATRFLNQNPLSRSDTHPLLLAHNNAVMNQKNQELTNLEGQVELERKRKQEHDNMRKASQGQNWCPPRIDELNYQQLDQLKRSVLSFKQNFETKVQNATSLGNPYVQHGSNPDAGTGGRLPWTNPNIGFPLDSNIQGPSDHLALYGNKEAMLTSKAPLVLGGSTSNSNVAFPTNPGASSYGASFFPDLVNTGPGFVDPFDPIVGNFGFTTVQYPPAAAASSSHAILPYNYGNPSDMVTYGVGTSTSNLEPERSPRATQSNVQNKSQGFSSNYGRGNT